MDYQSIPNLVEMYSIEPNTAIRHFFGRRPTANGTLLAESANIVRNCRALEDLGGTQIELGEPPKTGWNGW